MKYFFTLLVTFLCLTAKAQTEKELWGEWKFESVADDMGGDEQKNRKLAGLMKAYAFVFYPDRQYAATLMDVKELGTWRIEGNKIYKTFNGKEMAMEVLSFANGKMKLNTGGLIVNMAQMVTFSNPENLMHRWTFEGTRLDPEDEDLRPAPANNYIDLKPDNTYTAAVGPVHETGTWFYDDSTKAIIVTANGTTKQWQVVHINDKTLELHMNTAKTGFVFKR